MAWVFLVIAGLFEVVWAVGLKYTHGFTRLWPSIITLAGMFVSFFFLSLSLKTLPLGTGYAIWTGIGAVGTVILGMVMFGESRELIRIMFVFLIVTGIVGLKVTAGH